METCNDCQQDIASDLLKEEMCDSCITNKLELRKLRERISELEMELQKQKTATEEGEKLLNILWGDNFNTDSLH